MKSGWANGLRGIVALALLTGAAPTRGQSPQDSSVAGSAKEAPRLPPLPILTAPRQLLSPSPSAIPIQTGKTLTPGGIAQSLRALYRIADSTALRTAVSP